MRVFSKKKFYEVEKSEKVGECKWVEMSDGKEVIDGKINNTGYRSIPDWEVDIEEYCGYPEMITNKIFDFIVDGLQEIIFRDLPVNYCQTYIDVLINLKYSLSDVGKLQSIWQTIEPDINAAENLLKETEIK